MGVFRMKRKWTLDEQANFLKKLGELLIRGYPLSEALESVLYHLPKYRRQEINECLVTLKEGYPFYLILQKLKFDEHLTGYVFFAEQHGGMATAFIEGSNMVQKRANDFSKIKKLICLSTISDWNNSDSICICSKVFSTSFFFSFFFHECGSQYFHKVNLVCGSFFSSFSAIFQFYGDYFDLLLLIYF